VFTFVCAILASFIDRKVTARVQWRRGPPLFQPFYDFVKLIIKETMVPVGTSKLLFFIIPLTGLAATVITSTIIWKALLWPHVGFVGDLIVVLYLLLLPPLAVVLGGFASRNPLASIGASREIKLILAYELPFVLCVLVAIVKSGKISMFEIVRYQLSSGIIIGSLSGILAFVLLVVCAQAKLALVPFDISEAEQEIIAGPLIEYSGVPLAIFKLTKWMLMFVLASFIVCLLMPAGSIFVNLLRCLVVSIIMTLIRNTNPRIRIDQAVSFFWSYGLLISIIAILLALAKV
jgi:NADH-quinone oxidoreductase subunit H